MWGNPHCMDWKEYIHGNLLPNPHSSNFVMVYSGWLNLVELNLVLAWSHLCKSKCDIHVTFFQCTFYHLMQIFFKNKNFLCYIIWAINKIVSGNYNLYTGYFWALHYLPSMHIMYMECSQGMSKHGMWTCTPTVFMFKAYYSHTVLHTNPIYRDIK